MDDEGRQCCSVYINDVCSNVCDEGEAIGSNFTCINITGMYVCNSCHKVYKGVWSLSALNVVPEGVTLYHMRG